MRKYTILHTFHDGNRNNGQTSRNRKRNEVSRYVRNTLRSYYASLQIYIRKVLRYDSTKDVKMEHALMFNFLLMRTCIAIEPALCLTSIFNRSEPYCITINNTL